MQRQSRGVRRYWWTLPLAAAAGLILTVVVLLGSDPDLATELGPGSTASSAAESITTTPRAADATTPDADPAGTGSPDRSTDRPTGELVSAYRPQEPMTSDDAVASHRDSAAGPAFSARWGEDASSLIVTTYGSSSCAHGLDVITLVGPQRIEMSTGLDESVARSCTADVAPFVSEIIVPEGADPEAGLTIVIGELQLELPPRT